MQSEPVSDWAAPRREDRETRIAVVSEVSATEKNAALMEALSGRGHHVYNAAMNPSAATPGLTYMNTGFLATLLLNAGRADLVVGGCGTGQGFLNSVMQYPGVVAGLIVEPLDAWLFAGSTRATAFPSLSTRGTDGRGMSTSG